MLNANCSQVDIGPAIKTFGLAGASLLAFHLLACLYYWLGSADESGTGWALRPVYFNQSESERYATSMFFSVFGALPDPSATEMVMLVVNHFLLNGLLYGMVTASLASTLVSMTASSQRCVCRRRSQRDDMQVE